MFEWTARTYPLVPIVNSLGHNEKAPQPAD